MKKTTSQRQVKFEGGQVPFVGLLYGLSEVGDDLLHVAGIGAYLTLVAGSFLILASLGIIRSFGGTRK